MRRSDMHGSHVGTRKWIASATIAAVGLLTMVGCDGDPPSLQADAAVGAGGEPAVDSAQGDVGASQSSDAPEQQGEADFSPGEALDALPNEQQLEVAADAGEHNRHGRDSAGDEDGGGEGDIEAPEDAHQAGDAQPAEDGLAVGADAGSGGDSAGGVEGVCIEPGSGQISNLTNGFVACAPFAVMAEVEDSDGIARIGVTIDDFENCKFGVDVAGAPLEQSAEIVVDPGACGLPAGTYPLGLWVKDVCGDTGGFPVHVITFTWAPSGTCGDGCPQCTQCHGATGCCVPVSQGNACAGPGGQSGCCGLGACQWIETTPPLNSWTANPPPWVNNCECGPSTPSCWGIYKAKANAVSCNEASLTFAKADGSGPSVDVSAWVTVHESKSPMCFQKSQYVDRWSGLWKAGTQLTPPPIAVWPNQAAFLAAPCEDTKNLSALSGGAPSPTSKSWMTYEALTFRKKCAQQ